MRNTPVKLPSKFKTAVDPGPGIISSHSQWASTTFLQLEVAALVNYFIRPYQDHWNGCKTLRYLLGLAQTFFWPGWGSGGRDRRRKWCVYYEYNDECNNMSLLCLSYSNMIITLLECAIIPSISCIEIYIFIYNITMMHCIICFYDRYQLQYV